MAGMEVVHHTLVLFDNSIELFRNAKVPRLKPLLVKGFKHIIQFSINAMRLSSSTRECTLCNLNIHLTHCAIETAAKIPISTLKSCFDDLARSLQATARLVELEWNAEPIREGRAHAIGNNLVDYVYLRCSPGFCRGDEKGRSNYSGECPDYRK